MKFFIFEPDHYASYVGNRLGYCITSEGDFIGNWISSSRAFLEYDLTNLAKSKYPDAKDFIFLTYDELDGNTEFQAALGLARAKGF